MTLNSDSSAVEGLPLKLIITALVLSITIPASVNALQAYDRMQAQENVRNEVEHLIISARQVYLGGAGSQRVIEFNPDGGMFYHLDWVSIGDAVGGQNESAIFYRFEDGSTKVILISNPRVALRGEGGGGVRIGPGRHQLVLQSKQDSSGIYVEIRVGG
jgi:hypothetical protein